MFRKWMMVCAACLTVGAGSVLAQEATPEAVPDAPAIFADVRLNANPVLDPFLMTVIAGGLVPASSLGEDCLGYLPTAPSATLTVNGEQENLGIFFRSESDTVLVVQTPDGSILCDDDSSSESLDPNVVITNAAAGRYVVFVGTFDQRTLAPGFLVFTSNPSLTPTTLSIASLVEAPPQLDAELALPALDLTQLDLSDNSAQAVIDVDAGFSSVDNAVTGGGAISALSLDTLGNICTGNIAAEPSAYVRVNAEQPFLRMFFNSTTDTTLLIVHVEDGAYACIDDSSGGLNPLVDVTDVQPGDYAVFVGSFDPLQTVTGTLVITSDSTQFPDMMAPAQPAGQ